MNHFPPQLSLNFLSWTAVHYCTSWTVPLFFFFYFSSLFVLPLVKFPQLYFPILLLFFFFLFHKLVLTGVMGEGVFITVESILKALEIMKRLEISVRYSWWSRSLHHLRSNNVKLQKSNLSKWCCKINLQLYFHTFEVVILSLDTLPLRAIVSLNHFRPSPISIFPLINNFQVPYLKNKSIHFSHPTHSILGNWCLLTWSLCSSSLKCILKQMDFDSFFFFQYYRMSMCLLQA